MAEHSLESIDVNGDNVVETGFFCCMSKRESEGYRQKFEWLKGRFAEGLKIKMIARGGRGFIEYIPGEYAWRAIHAPGYMVVHCLWVVGKAKGHGCGTALLDLCTAEAKQRGKCGVAVVTAHHRIGLPETGFFLRQGFKVVDAAPPGLELVALKFGQAPDPKFLGHWNQKLERLGRGLSVVTTAQCPYTCSLVEHLAELAKSRRIPLKAVRLETAEQVRNQAPSAYGTADIAADGRVLAHLDYCMTGDRLARLMNS